MHLIELHLLLNDDFIHRYIESTGSFRSPIMIDTVLETVIDKATNSLKKEAKAATTKAATISKERKAKTSLN